MKTELQNILNAAKGLSETERCLLVDQLLETLSPEADELSEAEFQAELMRRSADFQAGTAGAIPWSELKQEE